MTALNPHAFPKRAVPVPAIQEIALEVIEIRRETADIVSFTFGTDGDFRHLPGQAVALNLPMQDGVATRMFTIASAGLTPGSFTVTMKAAASGHATQWAHAALTPGTRLSARGPFGHFSLAFHPGEPLLLIGGGSGFTPMMSMLRWLHGRGEHVDVVVAQFAHASEDLLFADELTQIDREMPHLHRVDCVSTVPEGSAWSGYRGRVSRALLRSMVPDLARRRVFCCGPEGFMAEVGKIHRAEGGDPARFLTESFGPTKAPAPAEPTEPVAPGTGHKISYRGKSFDAIAGQPLTAVAARAGLRIPTGCGEGQCGTCRLRLTEGQVEMHHQGGLSARDEAAGYILACCSTAKSDLSLEDPA
ncbi:flavin reductase family protein [Celeribacter neptunius]|uniref:Ferredoxin-NADP reductase n=1 Tax=Celeribacter neptunius TaxID=588602 RepID=A0A1I3L302_9RHOB|nr:iron-sulfur cluster-binding domain-containing protein [Celeribacter neptunius]SFI79097.1 Ferredoxin-NADP reductase [Celeribacter neptunius]